MNSNSIQIHIRQESPGIRNVFIPAHMVLFCIISTLNLDKRYIAMIASRRHLSETTRTMHMAQTKSIIYIIDQPWPSMFCFFGFPCGDDVLVFLCVLSSFCNYCKGSADHVSNGMFMRIRQKQKHATFVRNTSKTRYTPVKWDRLENLICQHRERDRNEIQICIIRGH